MATPRDIIDIGTIYCEPAVEDHARGREILARFSDARRIEVGSHWRIPSLYGHEGSAEDWVRNKRGVLVLGVKKGLQLRPNERSANFIAPSTSNGCAMACTYCYVARRKGYANPITVFVNIDGVMRAVERHAGRQGAKLVPDQVDPHAWVYDLGENGDLSVDALISDNVRDLVGLFRALPNAKASFATKYVNRDLLAYDPQGRTRIRFSLMPERVARVVDVRTSPVDERIAAIDDFVRAGYELHLNLSPVIVYEGWEEDYRRLFEAVEAGLSPQSKAQLKAEVIFLTHNEDLHTVNLRWHPKAEEFLWRPDLQEIKRSQNGADNLRYRLDLKRDYLARFRKILGRTLPSCEVRYAF